MNPEPPAGPKLYLVGLRGTGKTTVGRLLAAKRQLPFHDADEVLEARAGLTIREIFATQGESAFRDLEERVLADLSVGGPAIIATGGGVILREVNRLRMRQTGMVVWLMAGVDELWRRLQEDSATAARRPDLTIGGRAEIEMLLRDREPLYRSCSDLVVDSSGRSPQEIVGDILVSCSTLSWTRP